MELPDMQKDGTTNTHPATTSSSSVLLLVEGLRWSILGLGFPVIQRVCQNNRTHLGLLSHVGKADCNLSLLLRIIECTGLERTFRGQLAQHPLQ